MAIYTRKTLKLMGVKADANGQLDDTERKALGDYMTRIEERLTQTVRLVEVFQKRLREKKFNNISTGEASAIHEMTNMLYRGITSLDAGKNGPREILRTINKG